MKKEVLAKLQCTECKRINHFTHKNKRKNRVKLSLKKLCPFCKKHTVHKEMKK